MSRTGLTEEVTWHIDGLAAVWEFIDNLQFDKQGLLREAHRIHVKIGARTYTVRIEAGARLDGVMDCFAAAMPTTFPARRVARPLERVEDSSANGRALPPRIGEAIVCIIAPTSRQRDCLGDFQERWEEFWLPRFGPRLAYWIYIAHAVRSGGALFWISAGSIVSDTVARLCNWLR